MRATRALTALGAAIAALGSLAGCGIEPTGVIQAGVPATGVRPPDRVRLYFVSPTGLQSASRPASGPVGPQDAVDLLLGGPSSAEMARGLTTELVPPIGLAKVTTQPERVEIFLSTDATRLSPNAVSQLTCTAANAAAGAGEGSVNGITVQISGGGFTRGPLRCTLSGAPTVPAPATTAP